MKKIILFLFLLTFYCSSVESSRRISASGDPEDIFFEKEETPEPKLETKTVENNTQTLPAKNNETTTRNAGISEPVAVTKEIKLEKDFDEVGFSSWYGSKFQGKKTASGEIFDKDKLTAAHPSLPIGSIIEVYNFDTGKETTVRINDRGPFVENRILDVTEKTADILNFKHAGVAKVGIKVVKKSDGVPADKVEEEMSADDEELELTAAIQDEKSQALTDKPVEKTPTVKTPIVMPVVYFIQVGVFKDKAGAEKIKETMQSDFKQPVKIVEKDGMFIVQLGNFKDRKQAEVVRDEMKGKGIDCFIPLK